MPEYLIDGWPDGIIETNAWVEVTTATDSEKKAIEFLESEMPIDDQFESEPAGTYHYRVTGQEWQRPCGYPVNMDVRVERPLDQYGPCHTCEGTRKIEVIAKIERRLPGASAEPATRLGAPATVAHLVGLPVTLHNMHKIERANGVVTRRADEECGDCYGTGKEADWLHGDEGWSWEACEEGADEAKLFWKLEVADEPDPRVNVSDDQTTLPGA